MKRLEQIKAWRKEEKTEEWIGLHLKPPITRQRVHQIFGGDGRKFFTPAETVERACSNCRETVVRLKSKKVRKNTYCDRKCAGDGRTKLVINIKSKVCKICKNRKLRKYFFNFTTTDKGTLTLDAYCKPCRIQVNEKWQTKNPERYKFITRRATKKYHARIRAEKKERLTEFLKSS